MEHLHLYKVTNIEPHRELYDVYTAMIVAAESEEAALCVHPHPDEGGAWRAGHALDPDNWPAYDRREHDLVAEYIGETVLPAGVVLAQYNAG